jgi:hypothetical protein
MGGEEILMKTELEFPNGPTVKADVTKQRLLAIHRTLTGGKGYVLTHVPSLAVVLWTEFQREAKEIQKELEAMDWVDGLDAVRARVLELRGGS